MTKEEKAKRYDEAIEKAKTLYENANGMILKKWVEQVFPELKESEDDKIRKELLSFCQNRADNYPNDPKYANIGNWIAWLEKQGEHANFRNKIQVGDKVTRNQDGVLVNLSQLNRVAKPADNIEPKFKVGDFIVNDYCMGRVIELTNDAYLLDTGQGIPFSFEYNAHLWTIQDAKDGDVLVYGDNPNNHHVEVTMIFKSLRNEKSAFTHFHIFNDELKTDDWSDCGKDAHPATKEQRDLLFQKMKEAGYEWDAEKKELKKIEPKTTDKKGMNLVEEKMTPFQKKVFCIIDTTIEEEHGLKQICDELLSLASNEIKQKPAWSEEDEDYINDLIKYFSQNEKIENTKEDIVIWIKSLKDRYTWKPSEGQLECLGYAIEKAEKDWSPLTNNRIYLTLKALKEQLEKLKETW